MKYSEEQLKRISQAAQVELARRSFWHFCQLMMPSFYKESRTYLKEFCDTLQNFFEGDADYLVINVPPRHGKSLTLQMFTLWMLGKKPESKIMTASYNEMFSTQFAKNVRDTIQAIKADEDIVVYSDVFPETKIKSGDASMSLWSLEGHYNSYLATSPKGTATGMGASLEIFDDIIKNSDEAYNETVKEAHFQWFANTMLSRLEKGGKIVVCQTRWSPILDSTPVLTTDGWKKHGELKVGDSVFGIDGKPVLITHVTEPVWCDMAVKTGKETIVCSGTHNWGVKSRRDNNVVVKTTQELYEESGIKYLPTINALQYTEQDLPVDPYWFGLWLGDGAKGEPKIRCGHKYTKHCESTIYNWRRIENHGDYFYIYTHQGISEKLKAMNVLGNKHIPDIYKKASVQQRLRLLAGLIDTDGDKHGNTLRFSNTNIKLYEDVKELCRGLGFGVSADSLVNKVGSIGINGTVRKHNCYRFSFIPSLEIPSAVEWKKCQVGKSKQRGIEVSKSEVQGYGRCITTTAKDGLYLVGKTLMPTHNTSDLAGRILKHFRDLGKKVLHVNYKALQDDGSMLCDDILTREDYETRKSTMNPDIFLANYQQELIDVKGSLYTHFKTYDKIPLDGGGTPLFTAYKVQIDTADKGNDYLCAIAYGVYQGNYYVLDVVFTQEPMEITETKVARMIMDNGIKTAKVESNNGGRGFARNVDDLLRNKYHYNGCVVKTFTQTANKVAKILSNSTNVMEHLIMPADWQVRWRDFATQMLTYQKAGKNAHDDAPDCASEIILDNISKGIKINPRILMRTAY